MLIPGLIGIALEITSQAVQHCGNSLKSLKQRKKKKEKKIGPGFDFSPDPLNPWGYNARGYNKGVMACSPVTATIRSGKVPLAAEPAGASGAGVGTLESRCFGRAAGTFPGTSVSAPRR